MTDEEKKAVLKKDHFYHITPRDNLASIKANGLDAGHEGWSLYKHYLNQPAIFLCTQAALPFAKQMFDNSLDHTQYVVLKVPALAVSRHECDVDHSFPDCTNGLSFLDCLEQVGFIACYGAISHDQLEVVEHQDELCLWQGGE